MTKMKVTRKKSKGAFGYRAGEIAGFMEIYVDVTKKLIIAQSKYRELGGREAMIKYYGEDRFDVIIAEYHRIPALVRKRLNISKLEELD